MSIILSVPSKYEKTNYNSILSYNDEEPYKIVNYNLEKDSHMLINPTQELGFFIKKTPNDNVEFENHVRGNYKFKVIYIVSNDSENPDNWTRKEFILSPHNQYDKIPKEDIIQLEKDQSNTRMKDMLGWNKFDIKIIVEYKKPWWQL
jgi:hypothetical protein